MPSKNDFELQLRRLALEEWQLKVRKARAEAETAEIILKATQDGARSLGVLVPKVPS